MAEVRREAVWRTSMGAPTGVGRPGVPTSGIPAVSLPPPAHPGEEHPDQHHFKAWHDSHANETSISVLHHENNEWDTKSGTP